MAFLILSQVSWSFEYAIRRIIFFSTIKCLMWDSQKNATLQMTTVEKWERFIASNWTGCDNLCMREPLKLNAHNNNHLIKPFRWTDTYAERAQTEVCVCVCVSRINRYCKWPYTNLCSNSNQNKVLKIRREKKVSRINDSNRMTQTSKYSLLLQIKKKSTSDTENPQTERAYTFEYDIVNLCFSDSLLLPLPRHANLLKRSTHLGRKIP